MALSRVLRLAGPVYKISLRNICTSCPSLVEQDWRVKNKLPRNPNGYGPLTDGRDFSYIDGRSSPVGVGQFRRLQKNKAFAEKILQIVGEMDFAVEYNLKKKKQLKAWETDMLNAKLKAKGHHMLSKKV